MKKFIIILLLAATCYAQSDIATGQNEATVGMPIGTKIFDIGFRKNEDINVASCRKTLYILIRWSQGAFSSDVVRFQIVLGVPKVLSFPTKSGLYRIDSLDVKLIEGFNFTTPRDVTEGDKFYVLNTGYASYLAQVYALNKAGVIVRRSQILYIKQLEKNAI